MGESFERVATEYCSIVESAHRISKEELLSQIYVLLPSLIDAAMKLPEIEAEDRRVPTQGSIAEWSNLYSLLKQKLDDWDVYKGVFDPTKDDEAVPGSLADDIADIYRDLKEGLVLTTTDPKEALFHWRLLFYAHWGRHAIDALAVMHSRISDSFI